MALSPVCVVGGLLLIRRPVILEVVHPFKPSYVTTQKPQVWTILVWLTA